MGRDDSLAVIAAALVRDEGRVAITALHGLRGVGKTTLAAAYAERHRADYRAIWWIRAQTEPTMRADLVGLGVRLNWVATDEKEEPALGAVMERLRVEGEGLLLIYDNAIDAEAVRPYLPRGGVTRVLVTSNAHAWRGVAEPVEIRLWPKEIGADYLIARTGRTAERAAAEMLSEALAGLPLAHEQAAAYCERLDMSFAEYRARFEATPAKILDDTRHAPADYHDGLTVTKTFALAIEKAAMLHPAAEPLIIHAALLAPEPIPLFLFSEARESFDEQFASTLAGDGLIEAVAALRAFALVDHEAIEDERDGAVVIDCIRLHRLVREVSTARSEGEARQDVRRTLMEALARVYPDEVYRDSNTWPRARRLGPLALAMVGDSDAAIPKNAEQAAANLLSGLGSYMFALAEYGGARLLLERALAIRERVLGSEHIEALRSLSNLGSVIQAQGDLAGARRFKERALLIHEKVLGPEHPETLTSLNNFAFALAEQGDLARARPLYERALAIRERVLGPEHPETAVSVNNLAVLLHDQSDLAGARPLCERALRIYEKVSGAESTETARSLGNLGDLLMDQNDLAGARPHYERALAIYKKALGPEHPHTARCLSDIARLLAAQGDIEGARPLYERALAIREKVLGAEHPDTARDLNNFAGLLRAQGNLAEARPLYERALAIREKVLGAEHPATATSLNNLASLLVAQGELARARPLYERALAIREKVLGPEHPNTVTVRNNLASLAPTKYK